MTSDRHDLTSTLLSIVPGTAPARVQEVIFSEVYEELREMAAAALRHERVGHTLQPTALVHEAYLRLIDYERVPWQGRAHFFGVAARAMRQILVDHARKRNAAKRSAGQQRVSLGEDIAAPSRPTIDVLVLDDMLTRLAELDSRMSRVVEYRVFGGLSIQELAEVLGVSSRTVDGDWTMAKKWIRREMSEA